MQIQKYETSDLDPLIAEATANQTVEEWTKKSFDEYIDAEWLRLMDYGNENYNLAAAFAYEENAFNLGLMDLSISYIGR
ncbi:MAG: hypothetical protein HQK79_23160 [Desulfobacterales bacterium]|nr:hypothetical protein [Desulfobacterales bacterium]